jgi:hypothetical protein
MSGFLGFSSTSQGSIINVNGSASNYEYSTTRTRRFAPGVATGTIRQFGVAQDNDGTDIFSLFSVSPAIVKSAAQTLDISYRLTLWPSLSDINGTALIGGINYDTTTSWLYGTINHGSVLAQYGPNTTASFWNAYDGIKGDLADTVPSGDEGTLSTTSPTSGTVASGSRDISKKWGLNEANTPTDICKTAKGRTSFGMYFNTEFAATDGGDIGGGIPKDATQELTLNWQLTWARK